MMHHGAPMHQPHAHYPMAAPGAPPVVPPQVKTRSYFFEWILEAQLVKEGQLSALNHLDPRDPSSPIVVGVDGGHLLSLLQSQMMRDEPHYYLSGPVPFGAARFLEGFINGFKEKKLRPVIVFDGMPVEPASDFLGVKPPPFEWATKVVDITSPLWPYQRMDRGRVSPTPQVPHLNRYMPTLQGGDIDALKKRVEACGLQNDEDFCGWVIRWLLHRGVDVLRAPYWAWPQLAAFLHKSNRCVSDVYGPPELLVFDHVERLVIEVDFTNSTFKYVVKQDVLNALYRMFNVPDVDLDLLLMFDSVHKYFSQVVYFNHQSRWQGFGVLARELLKPESDVKNFIQNSPRLFHLYMAVKQALVCLYNGELVPINKLGTLTKTENAPPMYQIPLRTFFGTRLPQCFNFFLLANVISPQTLSAVVNGRIHDPPMLVETKEGKIAIERVLPLRTQIVFQIVQQLAAPEHHNSWFSNEFALTWIRNNSPVPILRPPQIKLDEWINIRPNEEANFSSVLVYAANAGRDTSYATIKQALAAVHLKSLDLLGYFTHATHSNTAEVSGKSVYSEALSFCNGSAPDLAVLLIELLRTRSLTDAELTQWPSNPQYKLMEGCRFFARLVSLVPVELKQAYNGPTCCALLGFNAIVRHLHRTLRSLTEVVSLTLYLEDRIAFRLEEYAKFPEQLPFGHPPGIIAGVVGQFMLMGPAEPTANEEWRRIEDVGKRYTYLAATFPDVKDIKQVVADIFGFWDIGVLMLIQLSRDDTPTVEESIIKLALKFHNDRVLGLAQQYGITLQPRNVDA